jgi:putative hydrolase of the HAD superfamily
MITAQKCEVRPFKPPWSQIDTVLLDMDGTLLDLRFDNYFWAELVPAKYAEKNALSHAAARAELEPRFAARRGELSWYCTDHWSRELDLPIAALKHEARAQIGWLRGAQEFLRQIRTLGKRMLLVTNAHHDTLRIKDTQTGLSCYFDRLVSSHTLGHAKESPEFWRRLHDAHPFDTQRTLFVDDSLAVLRAARGHGIAHIVAVTHPDSAQSPRSCEEFPSVARVAELLEL